MTTKHLTLADAAKRVAGTESDLAAEREIQQASEHYLRTLLAYMDATTAAFIADAGADLGPFECDETALAALKRSVKWRRKTIRAISDELARLRDALEQAQRAAAEPES